MEIRNMEEIPYMEFPTGRRTHVMIGSNGAIKGEKFCQGFVEIEPSGSIPPHEHETVESYTVLSGEGEITIDGEKSVMKRGDYVFISPLKRHGLVNSGKDVMRLMFVYAPQIVVDHWEREMNGTLK